MRGLPRLFVSLLLACGGSVGGDRSPGVDGGADAATLAVADCHDGVRNGHESDIDCGGPCDRCLGSQKCNGAADCASALCQGGVCVGGMACFNPCQDGVRDGDETDVDCGGTSCGGCSEGKACNSVMDCAGFDGEACSATR